MALEATRWQAAAIALHPSPMTPDVGDILAMLFVQTLWPRQNSLA